MAAALDADARVNLQRHLLELDGVLYAGIDENSSTLWLVRDPGDQTGPLELAVHNRIVSLGIDPDQFHVRITTPVSPGPRRRVRLAHVERVDEHRRVSINVGLEWEGTVHTGSANAEKGSAIELRTTAHATVDALERLTGEDLQVRVIGVKPMRAFDSDLMVISLVRAGGHERPLVGAVVVSADHLHAVATAVLSALNRKLGNFLHASD